MVENLGSGLRHRVTLQQPVLTPDGIGGCTRTWSDVVTLWAQISPVMPRTGTSAVTNSDRPFVDGHLEPVATHHVTMRYYCGINADMRLMYGTRILNIVSIININELDFTMQIVAKEGTGG